MDNFLIRCHVKIFLFLNTKKAIDFLSIFKGKSLQFLFEKVAAASAAEHFPWVAVYEMLGHGGIVLGFVLHTLSLATVYKGNIIKNLIMDCQSYTKYRPNETTGGIFVSWRRKEELPTGA